MFNTLRARLAAVVGLATILAVVLGALGLYGMSKANDGLKSVYANRTVALEQISRIDRLLVQSQLAMVEAVQDSMAATIKIKGALVEKNIAEMADIWKTYASGALSDNERQLATAFNTDRERFVEDGLRKTFKAMNDGDLASAGDLADKVQGLAVPLRKSIDVLRQLQVDEAKQEYEAASRRYATLRTLVIGALLVGAALALLLGTLLVRNVYGQLGGEPDYARQIVHGIAEGDLTVPVQLAAHDQGSLLFAMNGMQQRLAATIADIRSSTDAIAEAAGAIATGNAELAARSENQASSIEQTSASLLDLTSSVKSNADNTRQANQMAGSASDVAQRGSASVLRIVDTMESINGSAKKIADIIGVIDGIAFQTNILALNAAVEAARAGEQGRGFAVVASEVRNLAQRSAAAAKEIKDLINTSVDEVSQGTATVAQAGATMQEIVASVAQVTDIMQVISGANASQRDEIGQVSSAINEIDLATQQNAGMVEQAATASASLMQQVDLLGDLVRTFRLPPAAAGAKTGRSPERRLLRG